MIEFILLNVLFLLLSIVVYLFKSYKKPSVLLYWGIIIIYILPSYYAFLGGETYKSYTDEAAELFYMLGCVCILTVIFFYLADSFFKKNNSVVYSCNKLTLILFNFFLFFFLSYIIYYWADWPLLKALSGDIIDRPDIVGGVFQGYFFISSLISIVMPSFFLYYVGNETKSILISFLLLILTAFFLTIGGNKGLFLYFILFSYFSFSTKKINIKYIILVLFAGLFVYSTMKGVELTSINSYEYLIESILRRLFITQGISGPNVLQLYLNDLDLNQFNDRELKFYLFEYTYGYSPGSMPIAYTIDFFVRYGLFSSIVFSFSVMIILVFVFNILNSGDIVNRWLIFYTCYLIVMSGISFSNLYRFIAIITFAIIYNFISINKHKIGK